MKRPGLTNFTGTGRKIKNLPKADKPAFGG